MRVSNVDMILKLTRNHMYHSVGLSSRRGTSLLGETFVVVVQELLTCISKLSNKMAGTDSVSVFAEGTFEEQV